MPLSVIPVIDLMGGQVVRGVEGRRESYRPIESRLTPSAEPALIAAALTKVFPAKEVYLADLDAITGQSPMYEAWQAISDCGIQLLLDAGVTDLASAQQTLARCRGLANGVQLVIGLESLRSLEELERIVAHLGGDRTIFSLDLRQGQPLHESPVFKGTSASEIAEGAIRRGIQRMIVLDLASVGVSQGLSTLSLCRQLHDRHSQLRLISGGGVRSMADLHALAAVGCEGALVASALHDGSITPEQLEGL